MADTPRILVVDDDEMCREMMLRALPRFGLQPVGVASASRALALLENDPSYRLVLLDWMMPQMDGMAFLREFRARDTTTPVIMVTARSRREDVLAAIAAGVTDYVTKPIHLGKLVLKINGALSGKRPVVASSAQQAPEGAPPPAKREPVETPVLGLDAHTTFALMDVSESGCCLDSPFAIPDDSVLFLDLPDVAHRIALPEERCFPVRTIRCAPMGRRFRIGALFMGLTPETVMRLRRACISQGAFRCEERID